MRPPDDTEAAPDSVVTVAFETGGAYGRGSPSSAATVADDDTPDGGGDGGRGGGGQGLAGRLHGDPDRGREHRRRDGDLHRRGDGDAVRRLQGAERFADDSRGPAGREIAIETGGQSRSGSGRGEAPWEAPWEAPGAFPPGGATASGSVERGTRPSARPV